jgi:SSS family solute:Na+ symporter
MDFLIILIYFLFILAVGLVFSRLIKSGDDYFRAGAQGTWWLVGASMFMASISAYTFVGNSVGIYQAGWSPMAIYAANVSSFLLCAIGIAALYRQMRIVTVAEVLRERFGKSTELFVAFLVVINALIWCGVILYSLSIFSRLLLPSIDPSYMIVGVGIIVLAYCTAGGNWAILANDFIQGLILVSMTVLLSIICLYTAGGVSGFMDAIANHPTAAQDFKFITPPESPVAEGGFWSAKYGLTWVVAAFIAQFIVMTSLFQGVRYFSVKDSRSAGRASLLGAGLMLVGCITFFIPPMYARLFLEPEVLAMTTDALKAPEFSFAVVSRELLPNGLFAVMIVAMFSAAISSLDTGFNRNAALIVRNILPAIYALLGRKPISPRGEVWAGRLATNFCGIIVIGLALIYSNVQGMTIFELMLNIITIVITPQVVPLLLLLFVRRTASWAVLSSIVFGFAPSLLDLVFEFGWSYQVRTFIVFIASAVGFAVAIPFYRSSSAEYRARVDAFYTRMHRPIDFALEVGADSDALQMRFIGKFSLLLAGLMLFLFLLPNTWLDRLWIALVIIFICSVGLVLLSVGNRVKKSAQLNRCQKIPCS